MRVVLSLLYLLSAVLPLIGLLRLHKVASREGADIVKANSDDSETLRMGGFDELLKSLFAATVARPREVKVDFWLVGGGVVLGGLASILALWLLGAA